MVNSEAVVDIKPGDSGVGNIYPAGHFVAQLHIYCGFMGEMLTLTDFQLGPCCENYSFLDQAVADWVWSVFHPNLFC